MIENVRPASEEIAKAIEKELEISDPVNKATALFGLGVAQSGIKNDTGTKPPHN